MALELNVLALYKGEERYVFIYDDESRELLLDTLRDHAADPQQALNWFDAAVLTQKVWEQAAEAAESPPRPALRAR